MRISALPERTRTKQRYNLCFYPDELRRIDAYAESFGMSRSHFLVYCFEFWESYMIGHGEVGSDGREI